MQMEDTAIRATYEGDGRCRVVWLGGISYIEENQDE